jgi:hypothetical protein
MKLLYSVVCCLVVGVLGCGPQADAGWLGTPDRVAAGVEFYRNNDAALVNGAGPIAVFLVRVDPAAARLASPSACSR